MKTDMTNHPHRQIALALMFTALALPLAGTSQAYEYSLDYSVKGRYEYNDNVGLRADEELDVSGGKMSLPATLTMRSERLKASLMGELASSKYDDSGYDSNDQNLQGNATYQLERGTVTGHVGFKRDSTRDSAFLDTGIVGLEATRVEKGTLGGSGDYMFTEKNGIIGGVDYSDVSYASDRYQPYEYLSGYGGWTHQWTERTRLRLQAYASRYENDAALKVESDTIGAQAGFDSELSERLSVSVLAGWADVDTDYSTNLLVQLPNDSSDSTFTGEGNLTYREERYELTTKINSGTRPSGDGYLLQTTQLDLGYRYHVTEQSRFDFTLVGGNSSSLDSRINNDRDYARANLRMDYRFAPSWYVAGTYTYSYQDRQRALGDADSNAVYASLVFNPQKKTWSR
jgi:hypothetical protein